MVTVWKKAQTQSLTLGHQASPLPGRTTWALHTSQSGEDFPLGTRFHTQDPLMVIWVPSLFQKESSSFRTIGFTDNPFGVSQFPTVRKTFNACPCKITYNSLPGCLTVKKANQMPLRKDQAIRARLDPDPRP